eukprot:TRINITY_DN27686_c0_g1_i1.p1 TRINITY_DN27686_c0_g1~~TRINITY_DN27686_c0_g1_i1.p1  ORF type:complete len:424 (+),score=125.82 TRINITY_DN27686_c0_g1_i1:62-1333(+)
MAEANGTLSREALETELKGQKDEELKEMAKRLSKSIEGLKHIMAEIEDDNQALKEENAQINDTITFMMEELKKLKIGADNLIEPQLEEGPLDFVGRFWEKVKPRDSAYLVNENVGELKKVELNQDPQEELRRHVQERAKQVQEKAQIVSGQVQERAQIVGQRLQSTLGPSISNFWSKAEGLINEAKEDLRLAFPPSEAGDQKEKPETPSREKGKASRSNGAGGFAEFQAVMDKGFSFFGGGGQAAASSSSSSRASPKGETKRKSKQNKEGLKTESGGKTEEETPAAFNPPERVSACSPSEQETKPEEKTAEELKGKESEAPKEQNGEAAPLEKEKAAEEQISSTVLIEARIKLEDGTVQTLQVRAADRCKEVAKKFIQEHSLKAGFEQPLTKWLKQVESDAEKFPVAVEGDLPEIRKQFGKPK